VVIEWLHHCDQTRWPDAMGDTLNVLANEAETDYLSSLPAEQTKHYSRLYALLKWADVLANDGYTDPRITAGP
jgi:hypothetical protein